MKLVWNKASIAEYWHAGEYTITTSRTVVGGICTSSEYVVKYDGGEIGRFDTLRQAMDAADAHVPHA